MLQVLQMKDNRDEIIKRLSWLYKTKKNIIKDISVYDELRIDEMLTQTEYLDELPDYQPPTVEPDEPARSFRPKAMPAPEEADKYGRKAKPYIRVPYAVACDRSLSPEARLCYIILLQHCQKTSTCFPGQKRLGDLLGVKERRVRDYLAELETAHLITPGHDPQGRKQYSLTCWVPPHSG
jgi:hypothetical protein